MLMSIVYSVLLLHLHYVVETPTVNNGPPYTAFIAGLIAVVVLLYSLLLYTMPLHYLIAFKMVLFALKSASSLALFFFPFAADVSTRV